MSTPLTETEAQAYARYKELRGKDLCPACRKPGFPTPWAFAKHLGESRECFTKTAELVQRKTVPNGG